ncbi:MAG: hypothetical protein K0S55_2107 [Clostridia bacterium]|nr:hypothetical protein [Clostridia bacterium]
MKKAFLILICIYISFYISACTTTETKFLNGSAADIMKEVRKQVSFPAMIELSSYAPNGPDILKSYYGIVNPEKLKDYSIMIPQEDNYTEVAIFKLDKNKEENYDIVLDAIQKRYTDLYNTCKAYNPKKLNNLKNKILVRYKNAVVFIINDENEKEAILKTVDNFSNLTI